MKSPSQLSRQNIDEILVRPDATILETMKAIENGGAQIAMVVTGDNRRLVGVITDGVIRRAIIGGAGVDSSIEPLINPQFRSVEESTTRTAALDLMKCFSIKQLPIVNQSGGLIGLHLINDLISPEEYPNAAVILAGGKGTRLGSLTKSVPKPMIEVAGRPILERIVLHLVGSGIRKIFLSVNYLADQIEDHFENGARFGCRIEYLREESPLGTGGPLSLLDRDVVQHPVIVMNGDLITDFNVGAMIRSHLVDDNACTIGVRTYTHNIPFGCVRADGKRVQSLVEKPTHRETINTGIYVISPELIELVPNDFFPITDLIELALQRKESVGCFSIDNWIDVGLPEQLELARGGNH